MTQDSKIELSPDILNSNTDDKVVRFLFKNHGVRGEIARLTKSTQDMLCHHNYPRPVRALLLELACSAVLIAATLKANGQIMVQIQGGKGDRTLRYALVNIRKDLSFYGSALLKEGVSYSDDMTFRDLVGKDGVLIMSVIPEGGNKWQGVVPLEADTISEALENYFKESEQLDSRFLIESDTEHNTASGIMLQIIPEIKDNRESLSHLSVLAATVKPEEYATLSLYEILRRLYWNDEATAYAPQSTAFKCVCSRERCEGALMSLTHKELEEIAADPKGTSMTCQHCGRTYSFTQDELKKLLLKVSQ